MQKLFVVSDVVVVPGKGLVLLPGLRDEAECLDVGSKLELVCPDRTRFVARVSSVDWVNGTARVCIPFGHPVAPGTQVWLQQDESGIILRSTAQPAPIGAHRPQALTPLLHVVPPGMLLAGGSGRRR